MKQPVVITDLTRMSEQRVCLAGCLPDLTCVRPTFWEGEVSEEWLFHRGAVVIRPFATVELDLLRHRPDPPHTEDWKVERRHRRPVGTLTPDQRQDLLRRLDDGSIAAIFGAPIHQGPGWYVKSREGTRSLGTIQAAEVTHVGYEPNQRGKMDYRLAFTDQGSTAYQLAVTDLAFRHYLDWLRLGERQPPREAALALTATLRAATVFLRIGLTRGTWREYPGRCFLQVTGVYSFPDYLDGRCFADFGDRTSHA